MNNYREEFLKVWAETGGIIPQSLAARILNISDGTICTLIKRKKIRAYTPPNTKARPLAYLTDVINHKTHRKKQITTPSKNL